MAVITKSLDVMTFDELIERGWQVHAENPLQVATELEQNVRLAEDAAQAAAFLRLSNHTIGEHLHDWSRALGLAAIVVGAQPDNVDLPGALTALAVAQFMADDWKGGLASQARIVGIGMDSADSILVQINVQLGKNLTGGDALEEGKRLYESALVLARARENQASNHAVAVASNNLASELLAKRERTDIETSLMRDAARASREFWLKCGTWVNAERAEYLLALVHNAVNKPGTARDHGQHALDVINSNGGEKVDEAFVHLAMANSCRLLGDRASYEQHLLRAEQLAEAFDDPELIRWFADEKRKAVWTGT